MMISQPCCASEVRPPEAVPGGENGNRFEVYVCVGSYTWMNGIKLYCGSFLSFHSVLHVPSRSVVCMQLSCKWKAVKRDKMFVQKSVENVLRDRER